MSRTLDMTVGKPSVLILKLAFPLIITNIGQQLYMIVDAAVVGRGVGVKALAAVGAADWTYWLILWAVVGLAQGFATFVSRDFGRKDFETLNKTIAMSVVLTVLVSIILTVIGLLLTKPILTFLDTPADILQNATVYLLTMISGTLVVSLYNLAASILRAFGDGKSPLVAMVIAGVLNVGLDLLFVLVFRWGVFGAAFASVLAQLFSFIYCVVQLWRIEYVHLSRKDFQADFSMIKEMMLFGIPLSLQFAIIAISGIIIQSTINLQGSIFVAGYTAVNKMYGLLECTAISLGFSFTTYFAQNYGAGRKDRVLKGVRDGFWLAVFFAIIVMVIMLLFGQNILQLFLSKAEEGGAEALGIAWRYLFNMSVCLILLYVIYVYRNLLQAIGTSVWSMVSGMLEFVARVLMGKVVVLWLGVEALFYVEPIAWLGAFLPVVIPYYLLRKKYLFSSGPAQKLEE